LANWSDVRRIALALPGVTEEPSYGGTRSWKVNNKGVVWERPLRKADLEWLGERAPKGPVLGVRVPETEMKDVLLKADPSVFFTTPHFDGYPAVLIRLDKISLKQLKDVILEAWLCRAPKRAVDAYLKRRK
jgi:hypothetical protein